MLECKQTNTTTIIVVLNNAKFGKNIDRSGSFDSKERDDIDHSGVCISSLGCASNSSGQIMHIRVSEYIISWHTNVLPETMSEAVSNRDSPSKSSSLGVDR